MTKLNCFCGTGKPYEQCCHVFISGANDPDTPEQLMRSRYSAFVQADMDYIAETMRGPAAEDFDKASSVSWAESVSWVRLKVIDAEQTNENTGYVEFIAVFREDGHAAQKMHERSEFRRIGGRWYYWDGVRK